VQDAQTNQAATPMATPATPPTAPALTMPATFDVDAAAEDDAEALPVNNAVEVTVKVLASDEKLVEKLSETDGATDTAANEEKSLGRVS
jgi:hypothetical protein